MSDQQKPAKKPAKTVVFKRDAKSPTNSQATSVHGLLVEADGGGVQFTVTGRDGKRHASVKFGLGDSADVCAALSEFLYGTEFER